MIKLKDILKEEKLNEAPSKPKVGDEFEDGRLLYGRITKVDRKQIHVKPLSGLFGKAVDSVQYDIKKLKVSLETSKGKVLWEPK